LKVYYLTDPLFLEHDPGLGHPERRERLTAIEEGIRRAGLDRLLLSAPLFPATFGDLLRVHRRDYVEFVLGTKGRSYVFDPDTRTSPRSVESALLSAGSGIVAVDRVMEERGRATAFCAIRPPGHHAESGRAMGFCLFNNAGVSAGYAMERYNLRRIAILDPDLHHGNGTQEIFYRSPHVLYISTHRYPFYPGTGSLDEIGEGEGTGYTMNFPLPALAGDGVFLYLLEEAILPALTAYQPELCIISAGFDAHERDPLGDLMVTTEGFRLFYRRLFSFLTRRGIPFFLLLEGGYDLQALEGTIPLILSDLLGDAFVDSPLAQEGFSPPLWLDRMVETHRQRITRYLLGQG
jgi:acetoin utilization deacetylase AcuC-like enzyme